MFAYFWIIKKDKKISVSRPNVDPTKPGGKGISWGSNVPKYSNMNYKTLARIVNGRGIVW